MSPASVVVKCLGRRAIRGKKRIENMHGNSNLVVHIVTTRESAIFFVPVSQPVIPEAHIQAP